MVKFLLSVFFVVCMHYQVDNTALPIYGVILYIYSNFISILSKGMSSLLVPSSVITLN